MMQIFNLLKNTELWSMPTLFEPLSGQIVHGEPLGSSSDKILYKLKKHFQISERIEYKDDIELNQVINHSFAILPNHFLIQDVIIYIAGIEETEEFINNVLGGVSGYAWPNVVFLYLNPKKDWKELLLRTALHEFNHCQRYKFSNPYNSLLDWLIFEGLAESFESEMTNQSVKFEQLEATAKKYIPELRALWSQLPEDGHEWFFGSKNRDIPVGLGYTIGHYLVDSFRRRYSNIGWSELIKLPSEEFVKKLI